MAWNRNRTNNKRPKASFQATKSQQKSEENSEFFVLVIASPLPNGRILQTNKSSLRENRVFI